jgi:uncharacterized protein
MTPEERQLITGLFDRLRSFGRPDKDKEAEALINQSVRAMPDAPYMLVQSTLIQEQALEATHSRLQEVEGRLRDLEEGRSKSASSSGSFLGGLFGTRAAAPPSQPPAASSDRQSPWSGSAQQQMAPPPASGGFLQSAMTTAAGVAGGMLAAGAIRDLLGGGAHANPVHAAEARRDHEALARQDAEDDARSDARDQDAQDDADADAEDPASSDTGDAGDDIEV